MEEIWKDIKDYEGLYQVSNLGRVKSLSNIKSKREKLLKLTLRTNGYYMVILYKNTKRAAKNVHRLVAETFIPNPDNLPQVNHKDEDKTNNCVGNLEWCDSKYNINYSMGKAVKCIETGIIYNSLTEASNDNKIDLGLLSRVCGKNNYTARWLSLELYK